MKIAALDGLAGLSAGTGMPAYFEASDLTSYGSCSAPLLLTVPSTATEGNGVLVDAGQVCLPAALATNLNIVLASNDTTEVTVPASVTVLAGQTNATFDVTIVDDAEMGTQIATISASAPGYDGGTAIISVFDNETATLTLNLPASASEGAGNNPRHGSCQCGHNQQR